MANFRSTASAPADPAGLASAADHLRAGRLVAFPTETVYGLGADARSGAAVADLYLAKGRPHFNPLIAHLATAEAAQREGRFGPSAVALAAAFWPGPLTLVVPVGPASTVCDLARAGLDSVALRVPDHPVARALLAEVAIPIAAPSANRSGHVSPTEAAHVAADLDGRIDFILDGGATPVGLESTVVSCLGETPRLLRPGGIPRAAIERVLGRTLAPVAAECDDDGRPAAPGMLASHYAPAARLRLNATEVRPGEAVLDFAGRLALAEIPHRLDLSPTGDLREAAANLFGALRRLDAAGVAGIAVAPISLDGLGEAINDRLARAAAPRP